MSLPNDPVMLLSAVNMKLRDYYDSLDELCQSENVVKEELIDKLASINYEYDEINNKFM